MGVSSPKSAIVQPAPDTISPQTSDVEIGDKVTTTHIETLTNASTHPKWHLSSKTADGDTALALFSNPDDLHEVISPVDEARLQRKIDFMILPYLAVCYAFFYIDKTTLSYAAIFGIRDDLKLVGTQYSWFVLIFLEPLCYAVLQYSYSNLNRLSSIFYFGFLAWACKHPISFLSEY
jgi:hypothetical protein